MTRKEEADEMGNKIDTLQSEIMDFAEERIKEHGMDAGQLELTGVFSFGEGRFGVMSRKLHSLVEFWKERKLEENMSMYDIIAMVEGQYKTLVIQALLTMLQKTKKQFSSEEISALKGVLKSIHEEIEKRDKGMKVSQYIAELIDDEGEVDKDILLKVIKLIK